MASQNFGESYLINLDFPAKFPFPYKPERFTPQEKKVLSRFFTNFDKPVYAIFGLPQEVVGALFSRYSRTAKSVRRVFLDEFWSAEELGIKKLGVTKKSEEFQKAQERTRDFYKRVFAEYGDDSVIQMGSVHIAFEYVSQIAAKAIEDGRISAGYIEKSTRYVDFGDEVSNHFLFLETPEIMESNFASEFIKWNKALFGSYKKHLPKIIKFLRKKYPFNIITFKDPATGRLGKFSDISSPEEKERAKIAYERALKARALDTVRVFLPATTLTNLGAHFSGQAAENALNKLLSSEYAEVRLLGKMALEELLKTVPNFLQHVNHEYGDRTRNYFRQVKELQKDGAKQIIGKIKDSKTEDVELIDFDEDADVKVLSQIIYTAQGYERKSKKDILKKIKSLTSKQRRKLIYEVVLDRSGNGLNRRHKLPRAFEHTCLEAEFDVNFGIFRDIQRHRICTLERQYLNTEKLFTPPEFKDKTLRRILADYKKISSWTKKFHMRLRKNSDPKIQRAAEYISLFGNKLRFNVRANLRQWVFMAELRTIEGGHPAYRNAMQKAVKQINTALPWTTFLFAHVDWTPDYGLGRLKAELRTQEELSKLTKT